MVIAEHLDALGTEEGDRRAGVRLAEGGRQSRLHERQNISHTPSIERVSNAQSGASGVPGLAKVECSRIEIPQRGTAGGGGDCHGSQSTVQYRQLFPVPPRDLSLRVPYPAVQP